MNKQTDRGSAPEWTEEALEMKKDEGRKESRSQNPIFEAAFLISARMDGRGRKRNRTAGDKSCMVQSTFDLVTFSLVKSVNVIKTFPPYLFVYILFLSLYFSNEPRFSNFPQNDRLYSIINRSLTVQRDGGHQWQKNQSFFVAPRSWIFLFKVGGGGVWMEGGRNVYIAHRWFKKKS